MDDLRFTPALELSGLIEDRELSPVELAETFLAAIGDLDPQLRSYLTVLPDSALAEAREAEQRALRGARKGALDGVPYSIKDLEPTAGIRTTKGSKWFEDDVPEEDSAVAARLRGSGGVLLGKTNTPQYGYKGKGDNLLGPPCVNPWDTSRTAGGSSSGAAAAVAAGLGPLAQGSDGAGSIRIPASFCGVVGYKASYGVVPNYPSSSYWLAFAYSGPITRTVRDAALMLGEMAGYEPRDPLSLDAPPVDYVAACDGDLEGLRVAVSLDLGYAAVDPEVSASVLGAAQQFAELGCEVEQRDPGWPDPSEDFRTFFAVIHASEHGDRVRERPDWAEPGLREMVEEGELASGLELERANVTRSALYDTAVSFFDEFDLLLTPTMPLPAWPAEPEPEFPPEIDGRPIRHWTEHLPFTYPFNISGHPAISVPCGFTAAGLPVGLQIVGGRYADPLVLRAGAAFEAARPWAQLRPPLAEAVAESPERGNV